MTSKSNEPQVLPSSLRVFPLRLKPGDDLISSLLSFVSASKLRSAFVLTCCGSVTAATVRFAEKGKGELGQQEIRRFDEHFEICSLVGTISADGHGHHLHCVLGRKDGTSVSGHLVTAATPIFTTAEIVLGECVDVTFKREIDPSTGYPELTLHPHKEAEKQSD